MKTYATPILLVAAVLSLALLLAATTRTSSGRAQAPVRPTATRGTPHLAKALVNPASSPAAGAHDRVVGRTYVTRAACYRLFGHDSDSHGELGACLNRAR